MTEVPERQTRFRGEGRPKRRLSPSPTPKPMHTRSSTGKPTTPTTPTAKASTTKTRKSTGSVTESVADSKNDHLKSSRRRSVEEPKAESPPPAPTYRTHLQSGNIDLVLQHARQKWLVDGIFDKYWTKYSRKKQEDSGATKESMTKLSGEYTMIIEPHSFKVTFFSVRTAATQAHGPNSQTSSAEPPRPYISVQQQLSASQSPAPPSPSLAASASPAPSRPSNQPAANASGKPADRPPQGLGRGESAPNTDPVIQLLAARAATDTELKMLMKTVAQGKATEEELTVFQRHIDELNGIIQGQKNLSPTTAEQPSSSYPADPARHSSTPEISPAPTGPLSQPYPPIIPNGQQPISQYQQPVAFAKPKVPSAPKTVLSAVVFEFSEANGIRYLFPRKSILEYLPGSLEVIISFLIVRDGPPGRKGESKQYYTPVNMTLIADSPRQFDILSKIVLPREEVVSYMTDIMDRGELAEDVYLSSQLPDKQKAHVEEARARLEKLGYRTKPPFEAPNSLMPL